MAHFTSQKLLFYLSTCQTSRERIIFSYIWWSRTATFSWICPNPMQAALL